MLTHATMMQIVQGAGALFMALGVGVTWYGLNNCRLAIASRRWPASPGRVLNSFIQEKTTHYENRGWVTEYQARVEYEFFVGGQRFAGTRIHFGVPSASEVLAHARALVDYYFVGREIDVFHDPRKPSQCTLECTMAWLGMLAMTVTGLAAAAFGALMVAFPHQI